ncbi:MAG: helical backbone metal receptor [Acidobacteriota bacterium]
MTIITEVITLTDATGTSLSLAALPRRIISLVPSVTDTVFALGAGDRLVGITRYCAHPEDARLRLPVVGGTKSPRIEAIRELRPDLVLANQEENGREDVHALRRSVPVYVAFPRSVPEAIVEIRRLGMLLGREVAAHRLAGELTFQLHRLREQARRRRPFRYLYLIWRRPYMAAGPGTFIDAFFREGGGENALPLSSERYPGLEASDIDAARADAVLLSSEPYPFTEDHVGELMRSIKEGSRLKKRTLLVDGELLSWHGARLRRGMPYLSRLAAEIVARGRLQPAE